MKIDTQNDELYLFIVPSQKNFISKLNSFLLSIELICIYFKNTNPNNILRDGSYSTELTKLQSIFRVVTRYLEDATWGKNNFAKSNIRITLEELERVSHMLFVETGLIIKSYKYTNQEISTAILNYCDFFSSKIILIRDYVAMCDSNVLENLASVINIHNIKEIPCVPNPLPIKSTLELVLNRLYRVRNCDYFFPLKGLLRGNGIIINRNDFHDRIVSNLTAENLIDFKIVEHEYFVKITMNGVAKVEHNANLFYEFQDVSIYLNECKKNIAKGKIALSIEQIKLILLESDSAFINELHLIEHRWNSVESQSRLGIITQEVFSVNSNKIAYDILNLIDDISTQKKMKYG